MIRHFLCLAGAVCALALTPVQAADKPLAGIAYSPSGVAAEADIARGFDPARLKDDLAALAAFTPRIRTYSVGNGLEQVVPVAKSLGLTVSLGLRLGLDATRNGAEIDRALAIIKDNPGVVDRVFVGNEVLEGDLGPGSGALRGYIGRIKTALKDTGIQVGTGEPWNSWINHPEVAAMCDFIGVHLFPYWDGVPAANAVAYVGERMSQLQKLYPDKKLVIAETGWPAAGKTVKGAIPSPAAQVRYVREFVKAAAEAHYDYYLLEAYDQPWKAAREGTVGGAWGIMDARKRPKFSLR